ncbi:MAG: HD domain-containing phosphohydrolase [Bacillota bacterium]
MKFFKNSIINMFLIIIFLIILFMSLQNKDLELNLTNAEKEYIENNPVILLGPDPDFAPVEFYENGEFKGVVPDLVKYINENTKLNIKLVKYKTWDDVIKGIKDKEIDMLGAVSKSENRKEFLEFSNEFLTIPNVLVTRKNNNVVIKKDFSNIKLAVVENSAKHDLVLENFPNANIITVKNIQKGLEVVSIGNIDAYLGSLTQMSYYIDKYKFSNLKINRKLDDSLDYSFDIHFAVQKDNHILKSIINKILINMPKEKKESIINKWMGLNSFEYFVNKDAVIKGVLIAFIIFFLFVLIIQFLRYELRKRTKKIRSLNKKLRIELNRSKKIANNIAFSLISVIETYDPYTEGHSKNVAKYALLIAKKLDFDKLKLEECYYSALLHDVGKTIIPSKIICKKGKLSKKEYEIMKKHPKYSFKILKNIDDFDSIAKNVLYHHEYINGKGYPEGIKGNKIPIISRIISIADAFDAMTTDRVYREKLSKKEAIKELKRCCGTQFDKRLVQLFIQVLKKSNNIQKSEIIQ